MSYRLGIVAAGLATSLVGASAVLAQDVAPGEIAGPPVGVEVVAAPPAGFNAANASATESVQYGIPPAPDATASPKAYAEWARALAVPRVSPGAAKLTATNIFHGPAKSANVANGSATSYNWSGTAVVDNTNKPFANLGAIEGTFTVPIAQQAFGAATGSWDYASVWPGLDGWGSPDVLQGGIEADAYAKGSSKSAYYSAWVEWFPYSSTRVSTPSVSPGDIIFVEVWNTSSTVGYVYFVNYSTQQSITYKLTAPSGTKLVGNSAEWIVERPSVGGSLATLTNYVYVAWPAGVAWNYKTGSKKYYPGSASPPTGTWYVITGLDNNGKGISTASPQNANFLWSYDYGSAY